MSKMSVSDFCALSFIYFLYIPDRDMIYIINLHPITSINRKTKYVRTCY